MASYYDLVLGLLPLAFLGVTVAGLGAGLSLTASVPVAGTVGMGLVGHALFVRAPVDAPPVETTARGPAVETAD